MFSEREIFCRRTCSKSPTMCLVFWARDLDEKVCN